MDSHPHLDDEDDFGGDFSGNNSSGRRAGEKRSFGDLDEEEDDEFGPKKGKSKVEESGPGAATGMILSLRESLQNTKDSLAAREKELEAQRSENQKLRSACQNVPGMPAGTSPEPEVISKCVQKLISSEESLKEQLEKAKKKEAAFIVTLAKRDQEITDLKSTVRDLKTQSRPPSMQSRKLLLDPAIHEEFTRLKNLVEEKEKKIKELQDNVEAVNFTPSSKLGKMLMAKCRTLQEENEEIGAMASEGKIHELGMKIAVLKSQNTELRNHLDAIYKYMDGLTNDVARANELGFLVQEQLKGNRIKRPKETLSPKEVEDEHCDAAADDKAAGEANSIEAEIKKE